MSTSVEEEAYLAEVMGKEYALNVPCVVLYSDGEDVKLWSGTFGQVKEFEATVDQGRVYLLKFAVGASEVDYWTRKYLVIKTHWQRDERWREHTRSVLSTLKRKWLPDISQ